jgi:hypothetical protein
MGSTSRGGFELEIVWQDGVLTRAKVTSQLGRPLKLRLGDKVINLTTTAGKTIALNSELKVLTL